MWLSLQFIKFYFHRTEIRSCSLCRDSLESWVGWPDLSLSYRLVFFSIIPILS